MNLCFFWNSNKLWLLLSNNIILTTVVSNLLIPQSPECVVSVGNETTKFTLTPEEKTSLPMFTFISKSSTNTTEGENYDAEAYFSIALKAEWRAVSLQEQMGNRRILRSPHCDRRTKGVNVGEFSLLRELVLSDQDVFNLDAPTSKFRDVVNSIIHYWIFITYYWWNQYMEEQVKNLLLPFSIYELL